MKIGLGMAQFGFDYGVSNRNGKTPASEVERILAVAEANGIHVIDTAAGYGESEAVLGRTLPAEHRLKIVTKAPGFAGRAITNAEADELESAFRTSLARLGSSSLYGLLVHRADDLLGGGGQLMARMKSLQSAGLVEKIGASVYSAAQIDNLLAYCDIDLIQLPINMLDQRLLHSGHLAKLKKKGIEIHARSVFLQGLLLMLPDELPAFFEPIRGHLSECRAMILKQGVSPLAAALAFVQALEEVDVVICGVNDHRQLESLCKAAGAESRIDDYDRFALDDETFLNPANWRLQ